MPEIQSIGEVGVDVELTNPDKLLWPEAGLSKADLWQYYDRVADRLLDQLADRPLTLKRFPAGIGSDGFFQKNLPESAPTDLKRFRDWSESSNRHVDYALAETVGDLHWFAQVAAVEIHPWFARVDMPERADTLVFDLDPTAEDQSVPWAAHRLREVLDELDLAAIVKTSGKRGLHVCVPVERRYAPSALSGFGLAVARACADRHPEQLTVEMRKSDRGNRLLIDWSRNGRAQTLVAAWSPRAHPAATVSTPLSWDEVDDGLDPTSFTLTTAPDRPDHWAERPAPQRIEQARTALQAAGYPSVYRSPRARTTR